MARKSGILYVTMQLQPSLPPSQFHDWYNNEHGPARLRLPFIANGFRYRANDLSGGSGSAEKPEWMAIYDVTDMEELMKAPYVELRKAPVKTQRECDTMKQIKVDRKFFDLVGSRTADNFKPLEEVENEGTNNVLIAFSIIPQEDKREEIERWYVEEHMDMLSKVPGWLRTRNFTTSTIEGKNTVELLILHEFNPINGIGGEEFMAATGTQWSKNIEGAIKRTNRRAYNLVYTFGPAPRDLSALSESFSSYDSRTKTSPPRDEKRGTIESYITTRDNVDIPFKLEGSTHPYAPLIVLCNSILVDYGIWDNFINSFFSNPQNQRYRIIRYQKRGRFSACGSTPITVDLLSSDVIALLDALRVPRAAAIIGVSLGGATALNVGLKHVSRTAAFVACDTSAKSPAGNSKTWTERVTVAEKQSAVSAQGQKIVGDELAELTVRRWFVKQSYVGGETEREVDRVKGMVATNSLDGFKQSVRALFEYDMKPLLKGCVTRAMFVVGSGDGKLPKSMKELAGETGKSGARFEIIQDAGHLPMVEKPREFAAVITDFLN